MHNVLWLQVITQCFKIYLVVSSRCTIIQKKYSDVGSQCKVQKIKISYLKKRLQLIYPSIDHYQNYRCTMPYADKEVYKV